MKIAHWVYHLIRGGTEGQCARCAIGLAARGWEQRVVVFRRAGHFVEPVEAACGPVREVPIRHLLRPSTVAEILRLARWLRSEKIDLLHTWDADAAIFGSVAARLAGIPLVTSRRDLGAIYPPWKQRMLDRADRQAVKVVVNAQAIHDHFAARGLPDAKMELIPNTLPLPGEQDPAPRPSDDAWIRRLPPGRRLAVVNRLDPEKNTGLLVEALPLVRKEIPDATLVVVGDGPERPALEARAAALGLGPDAVAFLGDLDRVPALLPLCTLGALVPTSNEGTSNTLLEYMAAGLPAMATDCGGNAELLGRAGERGVLLSAAPSPEEAASAWIALLRNAGRARGIGAAAKAFVLARHAPGTVLDRWEAFYRPLLCIERHGEGGV
ncbi:MAG: glycosyltransferase [Kiritimatiellae bacterium]|nr:glycosyltransferase [Kiritimatiellia bacterium]